MRERQPTGDPGMSPDGSQVSVGSGAANGTIWVVDGPVCTFNWCGRDPQDRSTGRHPGYGTIIVDCTSSLLWVDDSARIMLGAKNGLEDRRGKLHIERASINRSLQSHLMRLGGIGALPGDDDDPTVVLGVPDHDGRTHYVLTLTRREPPAEGIIVTLVDLLVGFWLDRSNAERLFKLSVKESEFAELFSQGQRIETVAQRMGISLNTARLHLRHVFAKTGCCSQVELTRMLSRAAWAISIAHKRERRLPSIED